MVVVGVGGWCLSFVIARREPEKMEQFVIVQKNVPSIFAGL